MIAGFKPYPVMKDSGVPWLGRVPAHWEERRAKYFFKEVDERSTTGAEELLSVSHKTGVTPRSQKTVTMFLAESTVGYKLCRPGDVVVNTMWAWMAALGVTKQIGLVSPSYGVYRPRGWAFVPEFLDHLLRTPAYTSEYLVRSTGITASRLRLYPEQWLRIPLVCPPVDEQAAIVRFLDHADRRIRRYIRAKQKLIKLLEEQKQAIIHRAVTRGLDPNVRLKPSGVEWLGEVPADWEVSQLRRLVRRGRRITYGIVQPGEPDPSGRFMIRGQDYSAGWATPEKVFRVSDTVEISYRRSRLLTGDLVVTIVGAGVGNVAIVPEWLDGANITQTTARVSIDPNKADAEFVAAALQGPVGRHNVELYVKGAAQPGLNLEHVRVFLVPVPPLREQREIVTALRRETAPLQAAVDRAHQEGSLFREFRTRLVADVVTGKLDVRAAAAALVEEAGEQETIDAEPLVADDERSGDSDPDPVSGEAEA